MSVEAGEEILSSLKESDGGLRDTFGRAALVPPDTSWVTQIIKDDLPFEPR